MQTDEIEFRSDSNSGLTAELLSVAKQLFEPVKAASPQARAHFPKILRNNNFALLARVTTHQAYVEVVSKATALRRRPDETARLYRRLFSPADSGEPTAFRFAGSRLSRVSGVNISGAVPFSIGPDSSLCISDVVARGGVNDSSPIVAVELLYVLAFGPSIQPSGAWQELDSLIRLSISDWRNAR